MKLSNDEVLILVQTINPSVEYYRDVNERMFNALSNLQDRLEQYYQTTKQLEGE